MYQIVTKTPSAYSNIEIGAFIACVRAGGEVSTQGLIERIRAAPLLAFAYEEGALAGVAALKRPQSSYRRRIGAASGVDLAEPTLPYELGWVYVLPNARGNGLSILLCEAVLSSIEGAGVFATSRTDNEPMRRTLAKLGFEPGGNPFVSGRGEYELAVFVRRAAQPGAPAERQQPPSAPAAAR